MRCCEICNKKGISKFHGKGRFLCAMHYRQMRLFGKIFDHSKGTPNDIIKYDTYAEIILYTNGKEIGKGKIDLDDINNVKKYKWSLKNGGTSNGYIITHIKTHNKEYSKYKELHLHRFIFPKEINKKLVIDHINSDRSDNRKKNLRMCTNRQNLLHRSLAKNNKSGKTGVYFEKRRNLWKAQIMKDRKHMVLGFFDDINDAIQARLYAEKIYQGEFAPIK